MSNRGRVIGERSPLQKTNLVGYAILALITLVVVYFTRPLWHIIAFDLIYLNLVFFALAVVVGALYLFAGHKGTVTIAGGAMLVVVGALLLTFGGALSGAYLVSDIHPNELKGLPETTGIRYLPAEVAHTTTKTTMNDPLYVPGDTHPFDFRGELSYITPRVPNGIVNVFTRNANGALVIYANGTQKIIDQQFKYGEGMLVTDDIYWQMYTREYWSTIPQVYYVLDDESNELLAVAPYIKFDFVFPVFVPKWGGVFVTHGSGQIEDLTPEQAMSDPRFVGQRLYPEDLARMIGESWQFRNGIWNAFFVHYDQPELADASGAGNLMPYLIPVNGGFAWFNGFKPYGESESIYKIQFFDAHTGAISMYDVPANLNLCGPAKAISFVKTANPSYDWEKSIKAIEPRPIVKKDGTLYWQISITNEDFAGLSKTVLVHSVINSNNNAQILSFDSYDQIVAFLAGTKIPAAGATQMPGTTQVTVALNVKNMTNKQIVDTMQRLSVELSSRQF